MGLHNFSGNNDTNSSSSGGASGGIPGMPMPGQNSQYDINDFCINYNEKFKTAGPALFRDNVVKQTLSVLIGKTKPNALLIGSAGVGKTKIVEDIAYRIENNDALIPNCLKDYTIYELPLSVVMAGSSFVGQLEEKVNAIVDYASDKKNKVILFIDEIHQLVGRNEQYNKIAQILKPALARGDIKVIGATTLQEKQNLSDDPAFARRFSSIIVDELTKEQTFEILKMSRAGFIAHYQNKVAFDDDIIRHIVDIADEYNHVGSHRPDNAITLLDRTCANVLMDYLSKLNRAKINNDQITLQSLQSVSILNLSDTQIEVTAKKLSSGNAKSSEFKADEFKDILYGTIKGQDEVCDKLVDMLTRHSMRLWNDSKQPLTLLFAGKSGTGKTEVSKIIADYISASKPIILNMTEYFSDASINRIIGSPAGYVGSDSHQELPFDSLETNPYQVILLDEFEKCSKGVQRLFMQVFDEGELKTNRGKIIDFSKAIIIATTNAGQTEKRITVGFNKPSETDKKENINTMSKYFDIELLNRFKDILVFNTLSKENYTEIIKSIYEKESNRITAMKHKYKNKLPPEIPDDELTELVDNTYFEDFGARPARKAVQEYIENKLM